MKKSLFFQNELLCLMVEAENQFPNPEKVNSALQLERTTVNNCDVPVQVTCKI